MCCGPGSAVVIPTDCGLEDPGSNPIQALTVKAKVCFGESKESESLRSGGEVVW